MLSCALEKDAAKVCDAVTSDSSDATADPLWSLQETRLCNKTQLHALQDNLFALRLNERQKSVAAFGKRLRLASLTLQTPVADDILLNTLKTRLPARLQNQAMLVIDDFGTVRSVASKLTSTQ